MYSRMNAVLSKRGKKRGASPEVLAGWRAAFAPSDPSDFGVLDVLCGLRLPHKFTGTGDLEVKVRGASNWVPTIRKCHILAQTVLSRTGERMRVVRSQGGRASYPVDLSTLGFVTSRNLPFDHCGGDIKWEHEADGYALAVFEGFFDHARAWDDMLETLYAVAHTAEDFERTIRWSQPRYGKPTHADYPD